MRKTILIVLICTTFFGCGTEPPEMTHQFLELVYVPKQPTPTGKSNLYDFTVVRCPNSGNNCWLFSDFGDVLWFARFAEYYENNDVAGFFENENYRELFPEWALDNEEIDNIKNGYYGVRMYGDSSILVLSTNNPSAEVTTYNVLWAIDHNPND